MVPEPFLTVPVRSCRDLLHARHRARQVAQLLRFEPHEVTCIAAGAMLVALEGKRSARRAELCFAIVEGHLRVFARSTAADQDRRRSPRAAACGPAPDGAPHVLQKRLPRDDQQLAADDIAWLIRQVEQLAPSSALEEIARQNAEVLTLLAEVMARPAKRDSDSNPSAA